MPSSSSEWLSLSLVTGTGPTAMADIPGDTEVMEVTMAMAKERLRLMLSQDMEDTVGDMEGTEVTVLTGKYQSICGRKMTSKPLQLRLLCPFIRTPRIIPRQEIG